MHRLVVYMWTSVCDWHWLNVLCICVVQMPGWLTIAFSIFPAIDTWNIKHVMIFRWQSLFNELMREQDRILWDFIAEYTLIGCIVSILNNGFRISPWRSHYHKQTLIQWNINKHWFNEVSYFAENDTLWRRANKPIPLHKKR